MAGTSVFEVFRNCWYPLLTSLEISLPTRYPGYAKILMPLVAVFLDRGRHVVLLQEDAAGGSGSLEHVEAVFAQLVERVVVCLLF